MVGEWLKKRVGFILILFFCFTIFVFGQDKQDEQDKQLREEILSIYKSKGEQGLREFVRKQKDKISNKFIVDFAETGLKERKVEWLKACETLAKENKDEKTLVDVYLKTGKYLMHVSNFDEANRYYDMVIPIGERTNYTVGLGIAYQNKAFSALYTGNNSRAIEMFDKALQFFEKSDYVIGQGNVYLGKGLLYFYTGSNEKALEMYDKALPFFNKSGDNLGQGNILTSKGDIYYYMGDNLAAIESYDKALKYYEMENEPQSCGNIYLNKGDIYRRIGDYSKAIEMYKKSESFYNKSGSLIAQGNLYSAMGGVYLAKSRYSKATELYDKALIYFEKAGEPRGQANVYIHKNDIYYLTGNNSRAKKMLERAIELYGRVGDIKGLGKAYSGMGDILREQGDYLQAFRMYEKAIEYCKKAKYFIGLNRIYLVEGEIYLGTGNTAKADECYNKALPFYEKSGYLSVLGEIYHRKGLLSFYTNDFGIAMEMYEKAIQYLSKLENPIAMGDVYYSIGLLYSGRDLNLKAIEMFNKSQTFYDKVNAPHGKSNVLRSTGDIYFAEGNFSKALEMYEKTLHISKSTGSAEAKATDSYKKALALAKLKKKYKALVLFENAITNLEKIRRQTSISDLQRTFFLKVYVLYEDIALFMLENKFYDKGFKYAESMRARGFLDQMTEGLVKLGKGLKPGLKEERERLVGKFSALSRRMQETGGKDEKKLEELKEEYRWVESEFDDLLIKIRVENPLYASVNYPRPLSVRNLQKDVLKKGETLLSYFISEEKSYAFIISKDNFTVKPLKVKEDEIKGLVDRYLPAVKENNINDMKRYGSLLYQILFKPLEKYLDKTNDIIIVPMGELETIPFEALVVDKKKSERPVYLLEKYRVKYVQGATLLSILRKYYTRENTSKNFIGFGDPVYDYENFAQGKPEQGSPIRSPGEGNSIENEIKEIHRDRYARAGGIMNRLPQSGEEIQTIARLFEKESLRNVIHLRDQATEANAKAANMKDFAYIHFSCHGLLNDDFQSLVLSQLPPDKSSEDGYFTLNEIMNCDYNAKLVVLSACETGKGKMYKGEGVTGLTRAVMYAGTPAVVASLWKVDDRATKELMVTFYRNMLEKNLDKVEALRQAKLELLKSGNYASPYYWSPFIMYGE